nr:hypothetical protein [Microbacterium bovistercoris]
MIDVQLEERASRAARAWNFAGRAIRVELRIYDSLWRAALRRPKLVPGAVGFGYHRPVLTILLIFIGLSALEIPIIDLIVHRWLPVRIGFLALGIWGLTWMIGLLCAYFTRPHSVGPDGLRVREGLELDLLVPWEDFVSLEVVRKTVEGKPGRVFEDDGGRVCAVRVGSETNLEVRFEHPITVRLPGVAPKGGEHTIDVLRFWADDPRAVVGAVRAELARGDAAM